MTTWIKRCCWVASLLCSSLAIANEAFTTALAEMPTISVTASMPATSLTPYLKLLKDDAGTLQLADILAAKGQGFEPNHANAANFGFSHAAYWVSIQLRNDQSNPVAVLIRQDYPLIDYVDFWYSDNHGVWRSIATGDRRNFESRAIAVRDFIFPVSVPAHSSKNVYLRFKSDGPINIGLSASDQSHALSRISGEQLLYGAYYGGFLVLVIYNLILFLAVKDRTYVYYMVYVISYGLYMAVHNGLAFQYIWPTSPWLANQSLLFLLGISLLFGLQFSRMVCSTRTTAPRSDRIAVVLLAATGALLLTTPFLEYQDLILAYSLLTVMVCLCILLLGSLALLKGSLPARYFMVAWVTLLVSVLIYMLKSFGLLPHNFYTQNSFQLGSLLEMVLLSLALSARVNEIQKLGYADALTTLANRRYFDDLLPQEIATSIRTGQPLALIVLDIDHFKRINDEHGHAQGDEVLKEIGRLLRKYVRRPHLACRYGGEEFAVLLPNTRLDQAGVLAERLRVLVQKISLPDIGLTVSLGVACSDGTALIEPGALFEAADSALYQAKAEGRNCTRYYQLPVESRRTLEPLAEFGGV